MEFAEITKVEVLSRSETVNEYLDLGWKLVNIYNAPYDEQCPGYAQEARYVMAWCGDNPQYPKEDAGVYGWEL